jgi:hypothetical protein
MKPKAAARNGAGQAHSWVSPLNLHWAGVGLLALVNVYLLAQMALLWHESSKHDAQAMADQRIELKTAEISAQPLRGLDAKLARATTEADTFYKDRLPATDSAMVSELGVLTKQAGVRLVRVTYAPTPVLAGTAGALTQEQMDATLSGDYVALMRVINALERDKMFFLVTRVTLTGQQTGTVNLRLGLISYLRGSAAQDEPAGSEPAGVGAAATPQAGGGQ